MGTGVKCPFCNDDEWTYELSDNVPDFDYNPGVARSFKRVVKPGMWSCYSCEAKEDINFKPWEVKKPRKTSQKKECFLIPFEFGDQEDNWDYQIKFEGKNHLLILLTKNGWTSYAGTVWKDLVPIFKKADFAKKNTYYATLRIDARNEMKFNFNLEEQPEEDG